MSAKKARQNRQAAGGFQKEPKIPTPVNERSKNARRADVLALELERFVRQQSHRRLTIKEG